jgi:PAS domain S-box-containing protein
MAPMSLLAVTDLLLGAAVLALGLLVWRARAAAAEQERHGRSKRRLALLAESAHDILVMFDDAGRIVEANAQAVATYGWSRDELLRLHVRDLRAESSRDALEGQFYRAKQGEQFAFETLHRRRDGSEFPAEVSTSSVEIDGQRWILSIIRDVTERKRVEEALRESESKFREAFHGASVGIALVDPAGAFVEWNDALERMVGYSGEELSRLRFQDLLVPEDRPGSLAAFGAIVRGERDHNDMERRYLHKDGRIVHLRYRVGALRDKAGVLHRAIGIIEDVTERIEAEQERRRMQAQLAQSDRMASLGTLAAGVAHEINNPLTYVVGNVEAARAAVLQLAGSGSAQGALAASLAEIGEALEEAADGAARVRQIVGDLKVFSSPGRDSADELVDVRAVLRSSVNLARRLVTGRARLEEELAEVPWVSGSAARLGQVFLNLLVNAAQAIPSGQPERHRIRVTTRSDGRRVAVEVSDTGSGIPADRVCRIFDPFFTTKPQGEGTGLGLAICQTIVASHGGEIVVESEPGRGSTFRVVLPIAEALRPREPAPAPAAEGGAPGRRGRILVVDDEPFVLRALERILAPWHDVLLASGGAEALARIGDGAALDGVLCDVMMPGMNGMELYREIARRSPRLAAQVVFVTGGALMGDVRAFLDVAGVPVVEKPFAPAQILEAVQRLVAAGPPLTPPPRGA